MYYPYDVKSSLQFPMSKSHTPNTLDEMIQRTYLTCPMTTVLAMIVCCGTYASNMATTSVSVKIETIYFYQMLHFLLQTLYLKDASKSPDRNEAKKFENLHTVIGLGNWST